MVEKLNKEQAGMLGGRAKWAFVSPEERSQKMRELTRCCANWKCPGPGRAGRSWLVSITLCESGGVVRTVGHHAFDVALRHQLAKRRGRRRVGEHHVDLVEPRQFHHSGPVELAVVGGGADLPPLLHHCS